MVGESLEVFEFESYTGFLASTSGQVHFRAGDYKGDKFFVPSRDI